MSTPTGEVFRTDAPDGDTWWRLFRGGLEYGTFFSEVANNHLSMNAPRGHMRWYTNSGLRMELSGNRTNTINTFSVVQNGFVGISDQPLFFTTGVGPFSRLHLVDRANGTTNPGFFAQQFGYRRWMRNGVTFTGNSDQGYVGQKYQLEDDEDHTPMPNKSDMVVHWCNDLPGESGPDRMRHIFTESYTGAASGSHSEEGLEAMRMTPVHADTMNIGLGDFYAGNLADPINVTEPTERLDILNGRLRIRELPTSPSATNIDKIMVVDDNGRVHWRAINTWPSTGTGTADCKWTLIGPGNGNVVTAYTGNPGCSQADREVGIGISTPSSKLHVVADRANGGAQGGLRVDFTGLSTGMTTGIYSRVVPASGSSLDQARGVHGETLGAENYGWGVSGTVTPGPLDGLSIEVSGVGGLATGPASGSTCTQANGIRGEVSGSAGTITNGYGLWGRSTAGSITNSYGAYGYGVGGTMSTYGGYFRGSHAPSGTTVYGVRAAASGFAGSTVWAGYFDGNVNVVGTGYYVNGVFVASDESLKTNIEPLTSPLEVLEQLQPKTYNFIQSEHPRVSLPEGQQAGFLAQELEEVLPALVSNTSIAAELDSMGNVTSPAIDYKAVNYTGLVPYLVGAIQQLSANERAMAEEVRELRDQLAACCANPDRAATQPGIPASAGMTGTELENAGPGGEKLHIQPNPFNERTTVYYTLDKGGRAQLMANSADGKELRVLHEATLEKGSYPYVWNTAGLAAGVYYVTLLVDGQPVVKKAVKVDR